MKIIQKIKKRLCWEFHKNWDSIYRHFCFTPHIMKYDECVEYINTHRASLARIGDGELIAMYGKDLNFQKATPELMNGLRRVVSSNSDKCLIGIPDAFEHLERYTEVERNFWLAHFYLHRSQWYTFLRKNRKYASTFLSRFYSMEYNHDLSEWRLSKLRTLWEDRDVIFVEGRDSKIGVGNDLFNTARSIRRIIAPSKSAYDRYDDILRVAKEHATPDCLFILALGPAATVLAFDLSEAGHQALDLGHFDIEYEWYRMGATSKVFVTGKFSNEAAILSNSDNATVGELKTDTYNQQIIATIM